MVKKDNPEETPKELKDKDYQQAIEEKVRLMLDTEIQEPEKLAAESPVTDAPATAPEISGPVVINVTEPDEESKSGDELKADEVPDEPTAELEADPETDKAVDDIVSQESNDLLAAEDEKIAAAFTDKKPGVGQRIKNSWHAWWHNPLKRRLSLAVLLALLLGLGVVPSSRYFVLNTAGVRSSASLLVLDESTQQPLKNVSVQLGGKTGQTDKDGRVVLSKLRLGKAQLVIEKRAFAQYSSAVTIGWGSNPLGEFKVSPTGSQYSFVITDYLSGKPVSKAEAVSEEASALSDEEGKLKLTLDVDDSQTSAEVIITGDGYREEKVTLDLSNAAEVKIEMVSDRPHVFISRRSGRYDVYKIDADGKNEQKVLAGSGTERDDLVLIAHPEKEFAALVSTRENARNKDGFLLSTLTLVDLNAAAPSKVAQSERIQIVDWIGDRLIFVQIAAGESAESPKRHRLMSYDLDSGQVKELAAANYFNDILAIGSSIFYAPSNAYSNEKYGFYKISADGSAKQTVFNQEVWNVFRTEYDKLVLAAGQEWHEYQISANKSVKLSGEPANLKSRVYVDSLDRTHSLWVDERDGKGVLLAYSLSSKEDKVLHSHSGLSNPVRWLGNNAVVFRVSTSQETADYVMSLAGREPKKLKDVTNTAGIDRWYYY